jgi:hypothetical protein
MNVLTAPGQTAVQDFIESGPAQVITNNHNCNADNTPLHSISGSKLFKINEIMCYQKSGKEHDGQM